MENLISTARKRLKVGQAELAQRLGVHRSTVTRWEAGSAEISGPAKKLLEDMLSAPRLDRKAN